MSSFKKVSFWYLLVMLCVCSFAGGSHQKDKTTSTDNDVFIPTNEWKTVKKGQPIPQGLHVRMNLQTGITEAKLMENEVDDTAKKTALFAVGPPPSDLLEEKKKVVQTHKKAVHLQKNVRIVQTPPHVDGVHVMETDDGDQTVFANGKLTRQQLKDALDNLKFEDMGVATDEDVEQVTAGKFRSLAELKEDLAELNLGMRSESEEVAELMTKFLKAGSDEEEQLAALRDLEYIAHHVDAARDIVQGNGIKLIIIPSLNSTLHSLQSAGAKLLGAASQGNPEVQVAALKEGVVRLLLRQVVLGVRESLNQEYQRHKAALYALSCLVRGFPAAQRNLIEEGGLSILANLFDDTNTDIKVRIITLLHDLVLEATQASNEQASQQYKAVSLEKLLSQYGWCERVSLLLISPNVDNTAKREDDLSEPKWPDHDVVEKVVSAMVVFSPHCKNQFIHKSAIVQELLTLYTELAAQEEMFGSEENFYSELLELVSELTSLLRFRDEL